MIRTLNVRTRLIVIFVALEALLAFVFALAVYWFFSVEHMAEEDRNLRDKLHVLATSYDLVDDRIVLNVGRQAPGVLWGDSIAQIATLDGQLLYRNQVMSPVELPLQAGVGATRGSEAMFETVELPVVGAHRIAWSVDQHYGKPLVIAVASSLERLKAEQRELIRIMLPTAGGVVGLSAVLGWLAITRMLHPLRVMTRKARQITAEHLSDRLVVHNSHDEIGELATTLNDMIERMQKALDQSRRFTSDASHELRTPLACLRAELDSLAMQPNLSPECADSLGSVLEEVERLSQLLDALLTLTQLDAGRIHLQTELVDLNELAARVADRMSVRVGSKGAVLHMQPSDGTGQVRGDRRLLELVLMNLLDNAIKYGGQEITISVRADSAWIVLGVHDSGPELDPEHLPHLFERFYRADKSRSRFLGSVGLGLSLTKQWVELHQGRITASNSREAGTRFEVSLPRSAHED